MIKPFFALLSALFISCVSYAQTYTYTPKASMPSPRHGYSAVTVNGKMYIFGGSDLINVLDSLQEYDVVTDTWANKQPIPYAVTEAFVGVVNGKIYVIGGWNGNWAVNYVQEYDPVTNTWAQKTPMPTQRSGVSGAVIGGKIYVTCGWYGEYKILEVYDPAANVWVTKTDAPYGKLQDNGGTALGSNMYITGGCNYARTMCYDDNMQYNTATDVWTMKAPLPAPRFAGCAVAYKGKVHYFGGKSTNDPATASNTHYIYDEATDTWTTGLPLPEKLSYVTATVIGDKIYISGGMNSSGALVNTVWEYGMSPSYISTATLPAIAGLQVFPNPVTDKVHVKVNALRENARLTLCNSTGMAVKTIAVKQENITIDIDAMPAGVYVLMYSDNAQVESLKLVKL